MAGALLSRALLNPVLRRVAQTRKLYDMDPLQKGFQSLIRNRLLMLLFYT
jgi:hypothetical protein